LVALALGADASGAVRGQPPPSPMAGELERQSGPDLAGFYRARSWRPLWTDGGALRPEAAAVVTLLERAREDGLDPARHDPRALSRALEAPPSGGASLARAEIALSRAAADYIVDLRTPRPGFALTVTDPAAMPPPPTARTVLEQLARAPSLEEGLREARRMNPLYEQLRASLARAAPGDQALIRLNLERARPLPPNPGRRWLLVDIADARLWLYEDGRPAGSMRVIVGKPELPTPALAGVVRYSVLNPYWNVPPDLVRDRMAPRLASGDLAYFRAERLEALSDWSEAPRRLDPLEIDWQAVGAGAAPPRVRQLPGPGNMMGRVKFMLPNRLGIYLHDTPDKSLFRRAQRTLSAGCVRVEDPQRLADWLFGRPVDLKGSGEPEQRVDLPAPVPVYILYLTASPSPPGVVRRADVYGLDRGAGVRLASAG
jgi:murein L,D-transpeptidase YcbB/YkuD